MEGGPPMFRPGFTSPSSTLRPSLHFRVQDFHLLWSAHSRRVHPICHRFIRVRSPLLTESLLLSFPVGTEMFQFSTFALQPYAFRIGVPLRVGCPIQKSQDHSLVTSSPGLIAGSNVFHRLLTPRHPPYALIGLIVPTKPRRIHDLRHFSPLPIDSSCPCG